MQHLIDDAERSAALIAKVAVLPFCKWAFGGFVGPATRIAILVSLALFDESR